MARNGLLVTELVLGDDGNVVKGEDGFLLFKVFPITNTEVAQQQCDNNLKDRLAAMRTPDLRKFAEQLGDVTQWEQSNRAYILTHGVSGVERAHYRHPLPEYMYDAYIQY